MKKRKINFDDIIDVLREIINKDTETYYSEKLKEKLNKLGKSKITEITTNDLTNILNKIKKGKGKPKPLYIGDLEKILKDYFNEIKYNNIIMEYQSKMDDLVKMKLSKIKKLKRRKSKIRK